MARPLRLMTFNVQMLPWIADAVEGTTNDTPERADRVADAIFALPAWDRPDVIAFNEVFDEDGRERLLARLRGKWPHVVEKIHDGGVLEDSGLMLFSRTTLLVLPAGGNFAEAFFSDAEDDDAKSTKGVGIVQVASPDGVGLPVTIAFTHLQASYMSEDQYSDTREAQFGTLWQALEGVLNPAGPDYVVKLERSVLMGDLNIRGDSGAVSGEWGNIFGAQATQLTQNMHDPWRTAMHPPGDDTDWDRGVTNIDWKTGVQQRLDYMVFGNGNELPLVPHHIFSRLRNASDHFALEAIVQRRSDHCQPATAFDYTTFTAAAGGQSGTPSTLTVVDTELAHPGTYQWIFMPRPGTFTIWTAPEVQLRTYAMSDLSRPLAAQGELNISELAGTEVGNVLSDLVRERPVDPTGTTQASSEPFYLAVRSPKNHTGPRPVFILEHHGESPATAVVLLPNDAAQADFPSGQKLGEDDRCWFRAVMPTTFAGEPHDESFTVNSLPGHPAKRLSVVDTALQEIAWVGGAPGDDTVVARTTGDEMLYLVLERPNVNSPIYSVNWTSPVTYLMLDRPMGLFIDEETAGLGSDEVNLQVFMDDSPVWSGYWDDADKGERWPGLAEALISAFRSHLLPDATRVGFVSEITISYDEDDVTASSWSTEFVRALAPGEPDAVDRRITLPVPDTIGDGRYSFYCSLSRRI